MELPYSETQLELVGQILLGAACVDGKIEPEEIESIAGILQRHEASAWSDKVQERLHAFDAATFELAAACKTLGLHGAAERRTLLQLVAEVTSADDVHTDGEDDYIREVAEHLGAEPSEYKDLIVDFDDIFADNDSQDDFFA